MQASLQTGAQDHYGDGRLAMQVSDMYRTTRPVRGTAMAVVLGQT